CSRQQVAFVQGTRSLPLPVTVLVAPLERHPITYAALVGGGAPSPALAPPESTLVGWKVWLRSCLLSLFSARQRWMFLDWRMLFGGAGRLCCSCHRLTSYVYVSFSPCRYHPRRPWKTTCEPP